MAAATDIDSILEELKSKGHRVTPQRREIIRALMEAGGPQSVSQLRERLGARFPEIGVDTVYRNLHLLVDLGIINQINLLAKKGDLFEVGSSHHHHLVCLDCGEVLCLERCLLEDMELESARKYDFKITGHSFEIYGYCANCRRKLG